MEWLDEMLLRTAQKSGRTGRWQEAAIDPDQLVDQMSSEIDQVVREFNRLTPKAIPKIEQKAEQRRRPTWEGEDHRFVQLQVVQIDVGMHAVEVLRAQRDHFGKEKSGSESRRIVQGWTINGKPYLFVDGQAAPDVKSVVQTVLEPFLEELL